MRHRFFVRKTRSCVSVERSSDYTPIRYGDVLFAGSGETIDEIGKSVACLLQGPACCGGDVVVFRPSVDVDAAFMGYAADSGPAILQKSRMGRGITVMHVYGDQLKSLCLAFPPVPEQAAIVRYLNFVDRRIRRCVRARNALVKLLEEQKRATLELVATGKLDVRTGRPYSAYKPSGVAWLGSVPEHWEVARSRRLFTVRRELARPGDQQLSATQAYGVIPQSEYEDRVGRRVVKLSMHFEKRRHVEKDDFVISMRSFQGGLERAWASGAIRSSYVILKPAPEVDVAFFSYVLKSPAYIRALQSTGDFIRDGQDLTFGNFSRVDLPLPPLDEQGAIAQALRGILRGIETQIATSQREVELLEEHWNRLVVDVINGTVDVREAAAQLPDTIGEPEPFDDLDALAEDDEADGEGDLDTALEEVEA